VLAFGVSSIVLFDVVPECAHFQIQLHTSWLPRCLKRFWL
jgi:hypothetical protein